MPAATVLSWWRGHPAGWWNPADYNVASICVPIATQVPHAVGLAWGKKLRGEDVGRARLLRRRRDLRGRVPRGRELRRGHAAPRWSSSATTTSGRSRRRSPRRPSAEALVDKAVGYGMPGVRVDGRRRARRLRGDARGGRARPRGRGARRSSRRVSYRAAPHATADDPKAYIDLERVEEETRAASASAATRATSAGSASSTTSRPRRSAPRRRRHARRDRGRRGRAARRHRASSSSTPTATRRRELAARPRRAAPHPRRLQWLSKLLVEAINDCFHVELERDANVMVMGEDVGRAGGVFRATAGLRDRFGADRCVDTPLAEAGILGTAVGLCMAGWRPVCEMQYDAFSYPCLDQLITHVGRYRWRTGGGMEFPITIRMPYGGGVRAPELHDDSPETYYVHTPGIKVAIPSTPADAKGLLAAAIRDPDPVVDPRAEAPLPDAARRGARGRARRPAGEGAHGARGDRPDARRLRLDGAALASRRPTRSRPRPRSRCSTSARSSRSTRTRCSPPPAKTGRVVIVQEAPRVAGFGAELAAILAEKAILDLRGPGAPRDRLRRAVPVLADRGRVHAVGRARRGCCPPAPRVLALRWRRAGSALREASCTVLLAAALGPARNGATARAHVTVCYKRSRRERAAAALAGAGRFRLLASRRGDERGGSLERCAALRGAAGRRVVPPRGGRGRRVRARTEARARPGARQRARPERDRCLGRRRVGSRAATSPPTSRHACGPPRRRSRSGSSATTRGRASGCAS